MPTSIYEINRKHTINNQYFDDIKTQEQAYWLGFLWADGSINKTTKRCSGKNRLTVSQKETEKKQKRNICKNLQTVYNPIP